MDGDDLRFTSAPITPRRREYAQLFRIAGIHPLSFLLTGDQLTGMNTHWIDQRPAACIGPQQCRHCRDGHNIRWKGWISALAWPQRIHGLLPVTEFAAEQLLAMGPVGLPFRGMAVSLRKANDSKTAKILVRRHDVQLDCVLPVGFDPVPVLANLFHASFSYRRYYAGEALELPPVETREITSKNGEEVK